MTRTEPSVGLDLFWILGTLKKSLVRMVILFIAFVGLAVGMTVLNAMMVQVKENGSSPTVQIKATLVINPEFLVLHDYLNLNFYNYAWYVSQTQKDRDIILKETSKILGRELENADLKVLDNMITVNRETGSIFFVWNSKDEALSEANLKAYTSILMQHLKNFSVNRLDAFIALDPAGKPIQSALSDFARKARDSIKTGAMDVASLEMNKRYIGATAILPGAGYSGSFGFWVVLVLSCLYAAMLSVLAWAWFSEMRTQKKMHEERS